MPAARGRVVKTPKTDKPYKIVLEHEDGADTEQAVETVREGEARIRLETPEAAARDTSRDTPPTDS
jgi:hypothetical protein